MNLNFLERQVVSSKLRETIGRDNAQGVYLEFDEKGELKVTVCKTSPFVKLMNANNHISELLKQIKS